MCFASSFSRECVLYALDWGILTAAPKAQYDFKSRGNTGLVPIYKGLLAKHLEVYFEPIRLKFYQNDFETHQKVSMGTVPACK